MVSRIPGLQYVPEYLDAETHDRLLATVDQQSWLVTVDHRVQIFGYHYSHAKRAAFRIGGLPPWAADLGARLSRDRLLPRVPNQLVANDYRPGEGILRPRPFGGGALGLAARDSAADGRHLAARGQASVATRVVDVPRRAEWLRVMPRLRYMSMRYARHASLLLVAVIAGVLGSRNARTETPARASTPEGLQLLHTMQTALGGAEKIAAIQDYEEIVQAKSSNPDGSPLGEVHKRTRWMRSPNVLRLDQIGPRDTYVLYYDGTSGSGWEILPDLTGPDPLQTTGQAIALVGGELKFATSYLSGFQLNQWLADRTPGYTVTSPAPNVLRIEHDGAADDLTLDPTTGLPVKSAGVSLANPDRPVQAEMRYAAWTTVAGIRFPTQRANYHNGQKLGEITEATIRVNAGLVPEQLAAKPPGAAPDIPRD